jgi:hypothetical protein
VDGPPKITPWNKFRLIVMLSTMVLFIVVAITSSIHDSKICEPEHTENFIKLDYISKYYDCIKDIKLAKSSPGYIVNLLKDTFLVTDPIVIDKIRVMINNRKLGEWNHPSNKWEVELILDLNNNGTLNINVCRINNDSLKEMTHLYFASKDCTEEQPQYSLELGSYLEKIVSYQGVDYK